MYNWLKCNKYGFLDDMRNLVTEAPAYATRSLHNLRLPFPRLNVHKQTVIYNGLKFWNTLSDELKNKSSLASFKTHLKKSFLT